MTHESRGGRDGSKGRARHGDALAGLLGGKDGLAYPALTIIFEV